MPEFSRLLKPEHIAALPLEREIRAATGECQALARRFHLESLGLLAARLRISPWNHNGARVDGALQAHIVQRCVISLQPVPQSVTREFASFFITPAAPCQTDLPPQTSALEREDPEPIESDGIDLGELVAQQLSLAIDPYPHLPDARLPDFAAAAPPAAASPFAALSHRLLSEKG